MRCTLGRAPCFAGRRRVRVAVVLLDERLGFAGSELGDDPPVVAPPRKLLVGVLDPDDGDPFPPRLLDKAADVRDDRVALVSPLDDAVLHVDDEECGVRPVLECGHGLPFLTLGSYVLTREPFFVLDTRKVSPANLSGRTRARG